MKPLRIVLFDDVETHLQEVRASIQTALGNDGTVEPFPLIEERSENGEAKTYEKQIEERLRPKSEEISLVVADRDLSQATNFRGLSEPTIRRVCDLLGVAECGYARGETDDALTYVEAGDKREECIRLSLTPYQVFGQKIVDLAKSFEWLRDRAANAMQESHGSRLSPPKLLAKILDVEDQVERIALFALGDKNRLGDLPGWRRSSGLEQQRRLACMLGYWLWDSILFFPGLVVNEVAASSYLNIDETYFKGNSDVKALFASARYKGPFSVARGPLWWRPKLDKILSDSDVEDGRSLAASVLGCEIPSSQCCVDPSIPAGFVCMLSNRPVSSKNSTGNLLWLPRGADLARVSRTMLDEVGPWL